MLLAKDKWIKIEYKLIGVTMTERVLSEHFDHHDQFRIRLIFAPVYHQSVAYDIVEFDGGFGRLAQRSCSFGVTICR